MTDPKKPSEIIGECECRWCGAEAQVRKDKNGKLWVNCRCGQYFPRTAAGQDNLREKCRIFGAGDEPKPKPTVKADPPAAPVSTKIAKPAAAKVDPPAAPPSQVKAEPASSVFDDVL